MWKIFFLRTKATGREFIAIGDDEAKKVYADPDGPEDFLGEVSLAGVQSSAGNCVADAFDSVAGLFASLDDISALEEALNQTVKTAKIILA